MAVRRVLTRRSSPTEGVQYKGFGTGDAGNCRSVLPRHLSRAVGAGAEDLEGVTHVGEAVLGTHPGRPRLHGRTLHLHGPAALPADQVVVVTGRAGAVDGFTLV